MQRKIQFTYLVTRKVASQETKLAMSSIESGLHTHNSGMCVKANEDFLSDASQCYNE